MRRLLLATIVAVVIGAPISAAWGSSSAPTAPAAKTERTKTMHQGGTSDPKAGPGAHGGRQCPFEDAPAI